MKAEKISIGLLGMGVVGSAVARSLMQKADSLSQKIGLPIVLEKILVRDIHKRRSLEIPPGLLTQDAEEVLHHPEVDIVVELIGGERPALDFVTEALSRGKHVVTANKEILAKHGPRLLNQARENGVQLLFEASVGGGIPVIRPLMKDLLANDIRSIHAIINGTTNHILTRMAQGNLDFASALREAQEKGYAEPDPSKDVEGVDAAYKLAILATLAFRTPVALEDVYYEGITHLHPRDFRYALELGYVIKLLALARRDGPTFELRVHPALVSQSHPLAKVDGVLNAVEVEGDLVGKVVFQGRGAGALPTASAVLADILEVARTIARGGNHTPPPTFERELRVKPMAQLETRYYLRLTVADRAGVLAQIAKILGDLDISLASVIQKEADLKAQTAEIVIMTHPAREAALQQALEQIRKLEVVKEIGNLLRIEAS